MTPARKRRPAETLTGTVEAIRGPYGPKNDWYILTVRTDDGDRSVTGNLPATLRVGDCCEFHGHSETNAKYGEQFKARSAVLAQPRGDRAVIAYLQKFDGIGPVMAKRIVEAFGGEGAMATMDAGDAAKLATVRGISKAKAGTVIDGYRAVCATREQDMLFAEAGISEAMLNRMTSRFGSRKNVAKVLRDNPYKLVAADGIGFLKADAMAQRIGIEMTDPYRIRAGVAYTLSEQERAGHVYLDRPRLAIEGGKILGVGRGDIEREISAAVREGMAVEDDAGRVYSPDLYEAERRCADILRRMASEDFRVTISDVTPDEYGALDSDQRAALKAAVSRKIVVVTGGPGVGKTFTIKTIIRAVRQGDGKLRRIMLAAPTGKAAKRMQEATGVEAKTIHRLLRWNPGEGGFHYDESDPLPVDTLIIDETSMVDVRLMQSLLRAVPKSAQIIFVGDKDQLPSVGPGRVLGDMIESRKIPVAHLTHLHRQGAGSGIDRAAKLINAGTPLPLEHIERTGFVFPDAEDLVFHREEDAAKIPDLIFRFSRKILASGRFRPDDIMVLCPQRINVIGSNAMNPILRDRIHNPDGAAIFKTGFRIGDRVMQTRNDYDLDVFNGDIGIIRNIGVGGALTIDFDAGTKDARRVLYPLESLDCLALAYALTVHKSQGSEYPVVIMPIHETNWIMLKRGLFYTGLTRGKKLVVLIGTEKAANIAIKTVDGGGRNSALGERIGRGAA